MSMVSYSTCNTIMNYSTESYDVGLVYIYMVNCMWLPSNNSFDKQLCAHKKAGGISGWGNGSNSNRYNTLNWFL